MTDKIREELKATIDSHLSDWDKEGSFNKQLDRLIDHVIETLGECAPAFRIPPDAFCLYKDGNMWMCVRGNFKDLQESLAGFGPTRHEATIDLDRLERERQNAADLERR